VKKVLGIVLLVLAFSLVSAPAFAQQVELSLKYWHAGVGGADLWVADCAEYEVPVEEDDMAVGVLQLNGYPPDGLLSEERLTLQFGAGKSFVLSGSYSLSPTVSVGVSYWGLGRTDKVAKALDNNGAEFEEEEDGSIYRWSDRYYLLAVPWLDEDIPFESHYWERWYSEDDYYGSNFEGLITGEGSLSMSALDVSGMKALTGPDWKVGFSGGIRKAAFSQSQVIIFEALYENWDKLIPEHDYEYGSEKYRLGLDSTLNVSAIGPQVGIEGTYALADKLALKAGAKAGLLFGTAQTDATVKASLWDYDQETYEWILDEESVESIPHSSTDAVRITTYDLSAALAYRITDQLSVEAGYYASIWRGVPSLVQFSLDESMGADVAEDGGDSDPILWKQPEARTITVRGLTLGVNFKF
jgi:hypothetical protein